ncbi:RibD family protein [Amaricoccus macauensis]|uniref:RibD family protein n=1 Tax=Amaricoccus macauensis TaxID=57001 RepID=UPI003C7C00C2
MKPPVLNVDVSTDTWTQLLSLRDGARSCNGTVRDDPAFLLYGPVVARNGAGHLLSQVGQSLDGRVATASGDARDVSGADGIRHLHRCRALVDAVVVGIGTVIADDPSLTVREVDGPDPQRVVIDPNGRLPASAKMLSDGHPPPIIVQGEDGPDRNGLDTIVVPREGRYLSAVAIRQELARRGMHNILLEGGGTTIAIFLGAACVDRLHVTISPLIIGAGPAGLRLPEVELLSDAMRPETHVYDIGSDVLFDCQLRRA